MSDATPRRHTLCPAIVRMNDIVWDAAKAPSECEA